MSMIVPSSGLLFLRQAHDALCMAYYQLVIALSPYLLEYKLLGDSDGLTDLSRHNSFLAQWLAQSEHSTKMFCYFC